MPLTAAQTYAEIRGCLLRFKTILTLLVLILSETYVLYSAQPCNSSIPKADDWIYLLSQPHTCKWSLDAAEVGQKCIAVLEHSHIPVTMPKGYEGLNWEYVFVGFFYFMLKLF